MLVVIFHSNKKIFALEVKVTVTFLQWNLRLTIASKNPIKILCVGCTAAELHYFSSFLNPGVRLNCKQKDCSYDLRAGNALWAISNRKKNLEMFFLTFDILKQFCKTKSFSERRR